MNRITQCLHGRGTVSSVLQHCHKPQAEVPSNYLAFSTNYRPVVFWNLTDRCNLRCTHCYSKSGPGRTTEEELTTAEALGVIDDLAEMGVPLILFTGGEPLIREDIWELARYAGNRGLKMALSTNGTLITSDIAHRVKKCGIEYAGISLDGAKAATHNRFRNSCDAFEQTISAFAACKEAGLRCGVRITLTKENCRELEDLVDLSLSLGASRFCLYWLVPTGRGSDSYARLQLDKGEVTEALSILYRKANEIDPGTMEFLTVDAPQDCIHLIQSMERDGSADLEYARDLIASLKGGCSAGNRVANIDPCGNVYPCQFARSPDFLIGNIRLKPFSMLWADDGHPVLECFRRKPNRTEGKCKTCGYFDLCGGGCRVRAYAKTGDFLAEDPFCYIETE
ncbi:MAG: radical SAM protein [Methanoregula sp.]|uniref:radical SAM protein n=1 Tax=Methanoregula sp. TaxID=2052170 RepID=UPI003BB0B8D7